jgi:hypothetical protein
MKINPFHLFFRGAFFLSLSFFLTSCVEENTKAIDQGFDRTALLEHYADNIIIPNIEDLQQELVALEAAAFAYTDDKSSANYEDLQAQWKKTMIAYQYVSAFNFGPGQTSSGTISQRLGAFPVDTEALENYVSAGDSSLDNPNHNTRGLLAVEYLIFDKEKIYANIFNSFDYTPEGYYRRDYLNAVCSDMRQFADELLSEWLNYRDEFVSNNGTQAGNSVSVLFNHIIDNYERLKYDKIGTPLGNQPGQTQAEPESTEAYYSGTSVEMIKENFSFIMDLYFGSKKGGNYLDTGFDDYVLALPGGDQVNYDTENQIMSTSTAISKLYNFDHLSDLVTDNPQDVQKIYVEMQALTPFLKDDVPSLLGI